MTKLMRVMNSIQFRAEEKWAVYNIEDGVAQSDEIIAEERLA